MTTIVAAQHIFTSVTAEQSPARRRGYQTLFFTNGLSDQLVRAIENRAQYYTVQGEPTKQQFYALPNGQFAISNIVPLQEPDEFGRRGRYLAHTLVVDRKNLELLGNCPFDLLNQFSFIKEVDTAFSQGNMKSGEMPPVQFDVQRTWETRSYGDAQQYSINNLISVGRLAGQSKLLSQRSESVRLIGTSENQLKILSLMFFLCSPVDRILLSFDTHSSGCNWGSKIYFWVNGFMAVDQVNNVPASNFIDADKVMVRSTLSNNDDGPFSIWLNDYISAGKLKATTADDLKRFLFNSYWASLLDQAIEGKSVNIDAIPKDFVRDYAFLNADTIKEVWLSYLPSGLSRELSDLVGNQVRSSPMNFVKLIGGGFEPVHLNRFMYEFLMRLGSIPSKKDRSVLEKWIRTTNNMPLMGLIPLWNSNEKEWGKILQQLSDDDYAFTLRSLSKWNSYPLPIYYALVAAHASIGIRTIANSISPADWKRALAIIDRFPSEKQEIGFHELAKLVSSFDKSVLVEIADWLQNYRGEANELRSAMAKLDYQTKKRSWF